MRMCKQGALASTVPRPAAKALAALALFRRRWYDCRRAGSQRPEVLDCGSENQCLSTPGMTERLHGIIHSTSSLHRASIVDCIGVRGLASCTASLLLAS